MVKNRVRRLFPAVPLLVSLMIPPISFSRQVQCKILVNIVVLESEACGVGGLVCTTVWHKDCWVTTSCVCGTVV